MIFSSSSIALCLAFAILAAVVYYFGLKRKLKKPEKIFSNETIIFIGVLLTATSVAYLSEVLINIGSEHLKKYGIWNF
jgi:Kef-type K+ transport system membrane component KefB